MMPQPMVRLDEVQNKFILKAMEEANVRRSTALTALGAVLPLISAH